MIAKRDGCGFCGQPRRNYQKNSFSCCYKSDSLCYRGFQGQNFSMIIVQMQTKKGPLHYRTKRATKKAYSILTRSTLLLLDMWKCTCSDDIAFARTLTDLFLKRYKCKSRACGNLLKTFLVNGFHGQKGFFITQQCVQYFCNFLPQFLSCLLNVYGAFDSQVHGVAASCIQWGGFLWEYEKLCREITWFMHFPGWLALFVLILFPDIRQTAWRCATFPAACTCTFIARVSICLLID